MLDSLRSGWITTGPKAKRFEKEFAAYVGARHALAVAHCTGALHLALFALGVGPGDEVITTPFTFTATAEVIGYLGARPLFVDIEPGTFNLDPACVETALENGQHRRVRAILPVHFAGYACDMDRLLAIARSHEFENFGTVAKTSNGAYTNVTLNGTNYLMQQIWLNASGGKCAPWVLPLCSSSVAETTSFSI